MRSCGIEDDTKGRLQWGIESSSLAAGQAGSVKPVRRQQSLCHTQDPNQKPAILLTDKIYIVGSGEEAD